MRSPRLRRLVLAAGTGMAALALALWVGGVGDSVPGPAPGVQDVTARDLRLGAVHGLSGLTADAHGTLWSIPEEHRSLVRIDADDARVTAMLHGVPEGLDLESIAWLGPHRFAVGTEVRDAATTRHRILIVERTGTVARVVDVLDLDLRPAGVPPVSNQGIEGLCHAGNVLVGALETPGHHGGRRVATVAWLPMDVPGGRWTHRRVHLTSDTGKLAALDCRSEGDVLRVHAIERHYGVARLLAFDLDPSRPPNGTVTPEVVMDLTPRFTGSPNFEGLVVRDGVAWLVSDNHHGRPRGPTRLFRVTLPSNP